MKKSPFDIVEHFIYALQVENRELLSSYLSDDVMIFIQTGVAKDCLFVGKENFFKAYQKFDDTVRIARDSPLRLTWIVRDDTTIQMLAQNPCESAAQTDRFAIQYEIDNLQIQRIKIFVGSALEDTLEASLFT